MCYFYPFNLRIFNEQSELKRRRVNYFNNLPYYTQSTTHSNPQSTTFAISALSIHYRQVNVLF